MFKFIVLSYRLVLGLLVVAAVAWQFSERVFEPGFGAVNFFSYFTILSNLFIAGLFLSSAWTGGHARVLGLLRGAAVAYLVTTGVVYAFLLEPYAASGGLIVPWVNTVLHQIMPVATLVDWLLVPPGAKIRYRKIWLWLAFPVVYLAYSLTRGHFTGWYPYPFLDPHLSGGYAGVTRYCLIIAAGIIVLSFVVAWAGNRLRSYAESHPRLYPHFADFSSRVAEWHGVRRHRPALLLAVIVAALLVIVGLTTWRVLHSNRITMTHKVESSEYDRLQVESDSYQGEYFHGRVAYLKSENQSLNDDLRSSVSEHFESCKQAGLKNRRMPPVECSGSMRIIFATADYIQVLYEFKDSSASLESQMGLLYERKTGKRLSIADLFNPDSPFAQKLSQASGKVLNIAVAPDPQNFDNFFITKSEKFVVIFDPGEAAPEGEGVVRVELSPKPLYDTLSPTAKKLLPKLEAKKAHERELARQAEEARRKTRALVEADRSNVDCSKMKCIALTYDDGPSKYTAELLDIFKAREAVATLFVQGSRVAARNDVLKRAVDERNEVANHTWSHPKLTQLNAGSMQWQINQTNKAVLSATGVAPKLMRPPYGMKNEQVKVAAGLPLAMWNIDPKDWRDQDTNVIYERVIGGARPGGVVVMHDTLSSSIDASPRIIDELQRQGYVLVTMSELFGINGDNVGSFVGQVLRGR